MARVSLRIPSQFAPVLRDFAELTEEQVSELLDALQKVSPVVSTNTLSVDLKTPLPFFTEDQTFGLVSVLFNLWSIAASHNWDLRDVAETAATYHEVEIPEEKQPAFIDRLYTALNVPAIADTANAADVATEYDALFYVARCFTDIRPVHGKKTETGLTGAVIAHNLKFDYSTSGDIKSVTITLTESDLDELRRVLEQAKDRSQQTRDFLRSAGVHVFDFDESGGD